ncbi:MAG: ATP-binding protein [Planctomycetales bacterium]|nr:ATP-binding protein [Planctomycetales bacterium]
MEGEKRAVQRRPMVGARCKMEAGSHRVLRSLTVRNFKSLDGVTFSFEPINLFVGPNASGKSTALQAIEVLHALIQRPSISEYFAKERGWDYRDLPHRRNLSRTMSWQANFELRSSPDVEPEIYRYEVELQPRRNLGIGRESLVLTRPGRDPIELMTRTGRQTRVFDEKRERYLTQKLFNLPCSALQALTARDGSTGSILRFRQQLQSFQSFLLWNPRDLRRPHQGLADRLGPSGERLPGFWAYLQRKEPAKAQELLLLVQRIFPRVEAIQSSGRAGWAWHHLVIHERIGDRVIQYPADQASDGLLRMLAVFSLKFVPDPPRTITLEEPENGVHPHLLSQVISHLKDLADRKEPRKTQVFMSSHSPYVLNEFADRPESVHIFEKGSHDPIPQVRTLKERRSVITAAEGFNRSLGDLWYSNLLGGGAR